ncbi:TPA: pLS20_p028 family conjugation system transmembrane protein [Bacillus pseudomycoides]
MKEEEILKVLEEYGEYLQIGDIFNYILRWTGWFLILGASWVVDILENVTDAVLGIKSFFSAPQVQEFLETMYPVFIVLLALSFLYIGYMFILNKKMDRSQIVVNIFITMCVLCLLGTGMTKVDKFTDDAIAAVKPGQEGSISDEIIKKNLVDIARVDSAGWNNKEGMYPYNFIPEKEIRKIDIVEKIDKDFEFTKDKKLTDVGQEILQNKRVVNGEGKASLAELKDGWFDFFPEKYYRWHWNFWTMFITLVVMGITLLLVSIKLGRLFYALAFNYLLANILAPADVANGQKLKAVLTDILNIFIATIMIFLSLKLYMIGTGFIHDKLDGVAYILALVSFSMAVIDGPNVVERLFGIDIGLKSSWGVLAGGLSLGKGLGKAMNSKPGKGLAGMLGKGATSAAKGTAQGAVKTASAAAMTAGGMAGIISGLKKGNNDGKNESLQDEIKKAEQKKGQMNPLENKQQNQLKNEEEKKNGANASTHEDMNQEGNAKPEVASSQESGMTSLQDEMKEAGIKPEGSKGIAGTGKQGTNQGNLVTAGTIKEGSSQAGMESPNSTTSNEGGSSVESYRPIANESSSAGAESSRLATSEGSASSVESYSSVMGGNSEAAVASARTVSGEGNTPSEESYRPVASGRSEASMESPRTVTTGGSTPSEESYRTIATGGSPAPIESSRSAVSVGSASSGESYRPVASGGSPAPVESPRSTVSVGSTSSEESARPVASESNPVPIQHETRTLGQYTTDKVKQGVSSTTTSVKQSAIGVKEKIGNSQTVINTKRFYEMGQNTGKGWREIVSKNRNKNGEE